jgi:hypothetical protein
MGQTTRHNRHLAERLSPRTMTGEGGLPNEETDYERRSNSCGWKGFPGRCPGRERCWLPWKAAGVGPWDRLARD